MQNSEFYTIVGSDLSSIEDFQKSSNGEVSRDQLEFGFPTNDVCEAIVSTPQIQVEETQNKTVEVINKNPQQIGKKDIISTLKEVLSYLINDVSHRKHELIQLNPSRRTKVMHDLEQIRISSASTSGSLEESSLESLLYSDDPDIQNIISIYCHRVAHTTLIKFLLVRYWVDLELLNEKVVKYSDLNWTISKILSTGTQNLVSDKHSWLFIKQNSYTWYRTSEELTKVIAKKFEPYSIKDPGFDIINFLYETYLKSMLPNPYSNLTPNCLVKFTWDKALEAREGGISFFRQFGSHKQPKLIFDPTMGSGNFLLEAADRIANEIYASTDIDNKNLVLSNTIATALYGSDIDPFAFIFSEIKLLWKLSPTLIGKKAYLSTNYLTLSIIHHNSLKLHNEEQLEFNQKINIPNLESDNKYNFMPLEGHFKTVYGKIKNSVRFDFVLCCPPETTESTEQQPIKDIVKHFPFWQQYYCAGMDYSSWFFILGLSKLREGGRLGFVTNNYWPTSEGGTKLRKYILENAKVLEIIDLGSIKITPEGSPIPRFITIMERCSNKEHRDQNKIKISKVKPHPNQISVDDLIKQLIDGGKEITSHGQVLETDYLQIFFSAIPQSELDPSPWTIIQESDFSQVLQQISKTKTTLGSLCFLERREGAEEDEAWSENVFSSSSQEFLTTCEIGKMNNFQLITDLNGISQRDIVLSKKPNSKEALLYIQAILNSSLSTFWYQHNGNQRNGKFVYTLSTLNLMPIKTIKFDLNEDDIVAERRARTEQAIRRKDFKFLEASLKLEIDHGNEESVHDAIVGIQKEIRECLKKKGKYQPFIFMNKDGVEEISNIAIYPIFPKNRLCPLREHPAIQMEVCGETNIQTFCLTMVSREAGMKYEQEHLLLISNDGGSIKLYASQDLLDLLLVFLNQRVNDFWEEFSGAIFLPIDLHLWEAQKFEILNAYKNIYEEITSFINLIDQLIFKLYGFNPSSPDKEIQDFSKESINLMTSIKSSKSFNKRDTETN